ncbi:MAG: DUF4175 family protein [Pseudomonadota bacterium]
MTSELAQSELAQSASPKRRAAPGELQIFLTRLVMYWERLLPAMLPIMGVAAALTIFSLIDLWRLTPAWLHIAVLGLAGALCFVSFWRDIRMAAWPSRRAAQARMEADGAAPHAPLQALDDYPLDDEKSESPLWRAHLAQSAERAKAARLGAMRDTVTARDPYGVRFIVAGLVAISVIAGAESWRDRLAGLLSPGAGAAGVIVADVWIEPPDYTGKPPIYLLRAGDQTSGLRDQVNAPLGARIIVQANGRGRRTLSFETETGKTRASFEEDRTAARAEIALQESGLLRFRFGGQNAAWPIGVSPDNPPLAAFQTEPEEDENGLITFSYIVEDDYGIADARLEMRLDPDQARPLDAPALEADALEERRSIALESAPGRTGVRAASLDLQADPWAGLQVLARVVVADGAGQTGATSEAPLRLPTRQFFNPLARSVVEQRQTLAVAPAQWRRAGRSFDAVTFAPETFFDRSTDYLLLRAAFWRIMRQDGETFDDAVEKFWPLALQLEDDALELARQRLEAAEEALREAIERGADDEEIAQLTEELRQAMNDYLEALAQSGQTQQNAGGGGDSQQVEQSELDEMLDAIRDLAQSGAGAAARQMLSELQNILNNLRLSQGGSGSGGQGRGAPSESGPSGAAGDLIGRQRELADEAFERGREEGAGANADDLAEAESELGGDLDELIEELQSGGGEADPNGEAANALGQARNAMRQAEQALQNGDFDGAAGAMERAIAQMREGAEGLAREEMRQANQDGEGQTGGGRVDPLGRPVGEISGDGVEVPEKSDAARTRAVIDELRRRLGEPGREDDEIQYLERLLERF